MASRGWWLIFVFLFSLLGCGETKREEGKMAATTQISAAEWQALAQKRVVFGHQSVGQNILDGMQFLASKAGVNLPIVKSRSPVASGGINHFFVGENEKPFSKLADFASALEGGAGQGADIALVKFCYLDFNGNSNAKEIAEQYIATLDRLSQKFPSTTFVAVTAPLTVAQTGPKAWIKRLLGRVPSGYADNAVRNEFNDLLRAHYQKGRLFDLAKIETEGAGAYEYQGRSIQVLNPALTYDDGHLNSQGGQIVAARLVKILLEVGSK